MSFLIIVFVCVPLVSKSSVSFGFPEFYSTAFLDVLVKLYLVVTELGFIQHFSKSKAHSTKTNTVN